MKEGLLTLLFIVPIVAPIVYFVARVKGNKACDYMEEYIHLNKLDLRVVRSGIPPFRLWLHTEKGDDWVKVKEPDGSTYWARIRHREWSGKDPVSFFD